MLGLLATLQKGLGRVERAFQAWKENLEEGGTDVGIGQPFITACGKAAVHR
jgi:hypothetical protein